MVSQHKQDDSFDLSRPLYLDSYGDSNYTSPDDDDSAVYLLDSQSARKPYAPLALLAEPFSLSYWRRIQKCAFRRAKRVKRGHSRVSEWLRRFLRFICALSGALLLIVIMIGTFFPSYTRLPMHYRSLRARVRDGWEEGSANTHQEKVYIAATLFDPGGKLAAGDWAVNVLNLVHILGPENVYLSIYENDSGEEALEALSKLESRVACNHTLVSDAPLNFDDLPHVILPDGTRRIKRIAYLAEVRNRALRPLEQAQIRFDKLLYINDIMFNPVEAAQLLFSTNVDHEGRAQYRSACAVDFINPFKFYDTFATRDLDGFSMGVPWFPWFPAVGNEITLREVLSNSDAVRVRSCWGGMVAFDARFFQNWQDEAATIRTAGNNSSSNLTAPYRFRVEKELWWDSSECCLIQADIQSTDAANPGVYVNPYVRVAYDSRTLSWLWLSKRFEKLYTPVHIIADALAKLPDFNPRRKGVPWHTVEDDVWKYDDTKPANGTWHEVSRMAKHDDFCGRRRLQVMKEVIRPEGKNWEFIEPPPLLIG
ncbi:hypothetical protein LTR70_001615 [Exophiala xenobiotica]|uniref:Glycosyltransferase family 69 protein n=1 Tax=Lithohypha guttulata TaxID=1690604 RepID=A0ABR0K8E1_9EURO|nr:hypothetical protein LTR24_006143 [Lithohypha guttulata]KAK5327141.1 hypothetical protein LTR70_001615 [Exophiala xenobiotica]